MRPGRIALLATLCMLAVPAAATAAAPRVYNGTPVSGAPPWMAFVRVAVPGGADFCTAAAIAPNVVLTAAHCVVDFDRHAYVRPSQIAIAFGQSDPWGGLSAGTLQLAPVADYLVPSSFRMHGGAGAVHDVALLRTQAPAPGVLALLPPAKAGLLSVGRPVVVLGWGETTGGVPHSLQRADLRLQGYSRCSSTFGGYESATMLCGWSAQGQSACHGDSGGPLLVADASQRFYEIGVVSGGDAGCDVSFPNLFSNVATGALARFVAHYSAQLQHAADRSAPPSGRFVAPLAAPRAALSLATAVAAARSYALRNWGLHVYATTCTRRSSARFRCSIEGAKLGRRGWTGRMTITRTSGGVIVSR